MKKLALLLLALSPLAAFGQGSGRSVRVTDDDIDLGLLQFTDATTLTLSTGSVTAVQTLHIIAAETGTADQVDSISGGTTGDILILQADSGDTITLADGTAGGDNLDFGQDVVLDSVNERLMLGYNGTNWIILAVSPNVLGVTYIEKYEELHTGADSISIDTSTGQGYGSVHYVNATATITLPAVVDGTSFTIVAIGAVTITVDPNASDLIVRDGTAQTDGVTIVSPGAAGDIATFTYYDATGWYASTNSWTQGS